MIHTDAIPGHITQTIDITIGVLLDALTPVLIIPTMTPHIADHPQKELISFLSEPQQITFPFSIQTK